VRSRWPGLGEFDCYCVVEDDIREVRSVPVAEVERVMMNPRRNH